MKTSEEREMTFKDLDSPLFCHIDQDQDIDEARLQITAKSRTAFGLNTIIQDHLDGDEVTKETKVLMCLP